MEKRLLIAIALSVGLMLLWNTVLFPPPRPTVTAKPGVTAPEPGKDAQTTPARPMTPVAAEEAGPVPAAPGTEPTAPAAVPAERVEAAEPEEKTIETSLYRIRIANRGAAIVSWQLKKYSDDEGQPLDLISPGAAKVKRFPLGLEFADSKLDEEISRALFRMEIAPGPTGRGTRVSLRYADGAGLSISKILDFSADSYVTRAEINARRGGAPLEGQVIWGAGFGPDPGLVQGGGNRNHITQGVIHRDGTTVRHPREALKGKPQLVESGSVTWAGLEDHYFAGLLIPDTGTSGTVLRVHQVIEEGRERNFLSLGLALTGIQKYSLYVGPKDYDVLKSLNLGIEGIVDFGFFGAIAHALFFLLERINRFTGNWGWSIILLTVVIRVAFFPLTQKSSVSMRHTQEKMKKIQPKIQAIKERYRKMKRDIGGRQKMNEEIMALYSKEGVNPLAGMSGCLPLLLQLPILWGFYNLLNSAIELRQAPFAFWIKDLSSKDPYYVTPIVMGITMLIQQAMTSSSIPDPTQRRMMMLMPLMFTWFFKDLPSGLVLYWLINNILAIGQQYLINAQVARETSAGKAPARG
jgi:YidC/Oxa1 family membrane protein insertase